MIYTPWKIDSRKIKEQILYFLKMFRVCVFFKLSITKRLNFERKCPSRFKFKFGSNASNSILQTCLYSHCPITLYARIRTTCPSKKLKVNLEMYSFPSRRSHHLPSTLYRAHVIRIPRNFFHGYLSI